MEKPAVRTFVVPRHRLLRIWPTLAPGLTEYREKTPHQMPTEYELFHWLTSPAGDELLVVTVEGKYGGFLTFKIQDLEGERWGTIAIIYLTKVSQETRALSEITTQLGDILRARGCQVMNYMTAREGFRKLAPRLGFKQRITEWMKEL
jgi:hypothetical protein